MSGLIETLTANDEIQGQGKTVIEVADAGINAIAGMVGAGSALSTVDGILALINPPAGSSGPTLQDIQQQLSEFATSVTNKLDQIGKTIAGGQVQQWAHDLQQALTNPNGPLSIIGEIPAWKNGPGLPLPDSDNPGQYQIYARSALLQLIGGGPGAPWPTSYWYLPPGDLPLFQPDNPWTYAGTTKMFNKPEFYSLSPGELPADIDANYYTDGSAARIPQFDLSAFRFTNDFAPAAVAGVPPGNAFNPTWVLQQSMAAVNYYFIICGAVLKNFPNDGSTANDWVGNNPSSPADYNFLGVLSWYHDQLRAGIVCIAPPWPADLVPLGPGGLIPSSANGGYSGWSVPCSGNVDGTPEPFWSESWALASQGAASAPHSEWTRPFGALCSYTGFVAGVGGAQPSVDSYPDYVYPGAGQTATVPPSGGIDTGAPAGAGLEWYNGFYCKYLVACLWRVKLVYNGMGLSDMWRTINNLYVMFGKPPRPGPCFGDWSLKEVFRMFGAEDPLGSGNLSAYPLPSKDMVEFGLPDQWPFTVSGLLEFMNSASPTPQAPLNSLRAILQK
jgi:hypothetical protein